MPIISVIVPVYKVERYLRRCIDSILFQTFNDYDLILVDDGSPDECGAICDEYAKTDKRVHVIHQENGGLSAARNAGIDWSFEQSDSKWITFIDSDDWVHSKYLEALYRATLIDDVDVVLCNHITTVDEDFPEVEELNFQKRQVKEYYIENYDNSIIACGKLYRKDCFSFLRFPVGKLHEDAYIIYKILFNRQFILVIEQALYAYYQREDSIVRQPWTPQRMDEFEATEDQISYFLEVQESEIAEYIFNRLINLFIWHFSLIKSSTSINNNEKKYYQKIIRMRLRNVLKEYKKYNWISIWVKGNGRLAYAYAYPIVMLFRVIWRKIRAVMK